MTRPEIIDIHRHRGHGLRGDFLLDWQHDQGAAMDAPAFYHPAGSTHTMRHVTNGREWFNRSGHIMAPPAPASVHVVYVRHAGVLYRTQWEITDPADHWPMHCAEVRAVRKGARALRPSRLRGAIESRARSETLR